MLLECPTCEGKGTVTVRTEIGNKMIKVECRKCEGLGLYDPTIALRTKFWQEVGKIVATIIVLVASILLIFTGLSPDAQVIGLCLGGIGLAMLYVVFQNLPSNTRRMIRQLEAYEAIQQEKPKADKAWHLTDDGEYVDLVELEDPEFKSASH